MPEDIETKAAEDSKTTADSSVGKENDSAANANLGNKENINKEKTSIVEEMGPDKSEADGTPQADNNENTENKNGNIDVSEKNGQTSPSQQNRNEQTENTETLEDYLKEQENIRETSAHERRSFIQRISASRQQRKRENERWQDYYWFDRPHFKLFSIFPVPGLVKWIARVICYNFDKEYRMAVDRALAEQGIEDTENDLQEEKGGESNNRKSPERNKNSHEHTGQEKEAEEKQTNEYDGHDGKNNGKEMTEEGTELIDDAEIDDLISTMPSENDVETGKDTEEKARDNNAVIGKETEKTFAELRDEAAGYGGFEELDTRREKTDVYIKMIKAGTLTIENLKEISEEELKKLDMEQIYVKLIEADKDNPYAMYDIVRAQPAFLSDIPASQLAYTNADGKYNCYKLAKIIIQNPDSLLHMEHVHLSLKQIGKLEQEIESQLELQRERNGKDNYKFVLSRMLKANTAGNTELADKDLFKEEFIRDQSNKFIALLKNESYEKIPKRVFDIPAVRNEIPDKELPSMVESISHYLEKQDISDVSRQNAESIRENLEKEVKIRESKQQAIAKNADKPKTLRQQMTGTEKKAEEKSQKEQGKGIEH